MDYIQEEKNIYIRTLRLLGDDDYADDITNDYKEASNLSIHTYNNYVGETDNENVYKKADALVHAQIEKIEEGSDVFNPIEYVEDSEFTPKYIKQIEKDTESSVVDTDDDEGIRRRIKRSPHGRIKVHQSYMNARNVKKIRGTGSRRLKDYGVFLQEVYDKKMSQEETIAAINEIKSIEKSENLTSEEKTRKIREQEKSIILGHWYIVPIKIVEVYKNRGQFPFDNKDIYQEASKQILLGIKRYDEGHESEARFSTYISRRIYFAVFDHWANEEMSRYGYKKLEFWRSIKYLRLKKEAEESGTELSVELLKREFNIKTNRKIKEIIYIAENLEWARRSRATTEDVESLVQESGHQSIENKMLLAEMVAFLRGTNIYDEQLLRFVLNAFVNGEDILTPRYELREEYAKKYVAEYSGNDPKASWKQMLTYMREEYRKSVGTAEAEYKDEKKDILSVLSVIKPSVNSVTYPVFVADINQYINNYLEKTEKDVSAQDENAFIKKMSENNNNALPIQILDYKRDVIIFIGFAYRLNIAELNSLLDEAGCERVYARNINDCCLIYALKGRPEDSGEVGYGNWVELINKLKKGKKTNLLLTDNEATGFPLTIDEINKQIQDLSSMDITDSSKSITTRLFIEAVNINSSDEFIEFVEREQNSFVAMRKRAKKIILNELRDYCERDVSAVRVKRIDQNESVLTKGNKIKISTLLQRMDYYYGREILGVEDARGELKGTELQSKIPNTIKGQFFMDRITFLLILTFLLHDEYTTYSISDRDEVKNYVNGLLEEAGFMSIRREGDSIGNILLDMVISSREKRYEKGNLLIQEFGVNRIGLKDRLDDAVKTSYTPL